MATKHRTAKQAPPPRVVEIAPADLRALLRHPEAEAALAARRRLEALGIDEPSANVSVFVVRSLDKATASTVAHAVQLLPELIESRRRKIDEERLASATDALARLAPRDETQSAIEAENARLRVEFIKRYKCLTSHDIHKLSGSRSANAASTANRWKQHRKIFSVPSGGGDLFPAFQLRDGQPRPVIERILGVLPKDMSPWQIAFWFVSGNGWLGDRAPVDCLDDQEAVVAAARHEGEIIAG